MVKSVHLLPSSIGRGLAGSALLLLLLSATATNASAQARADYGCASSWADGTGLVWGVFCSDEDGPGDLYEREPDGDVRRLTYLGAEIGAATITPDGATVVFQATDSAVSETQIYSIERGATETRQLTFDGTNRDPVVDPAGGSIVFVSDRSGFPALWAMRVDGADQRPLFLASTQ